MTDSHIIGKFCSVAKPETIVLPKTIPGYNTPEGQVLKEDGQQINFIYIPINYNINYNLNGGVVIDKLKTSYTIEDEDYVPYNPVKEDNKFLGWTPTKLTKGTIGDFEFTANWKPNAILLSGKDLNNALISLANGANNIKAIQQATEVPSESYIDISSTSTPIYASYNNGIVYIYCKDPIYCNLDMKDAFKNFTLLRDISALYRFNCKMNTNIAGLFENCALLSNVYAIEEWANGKFSDFTKAFSGTAALECGRVPIWYRWKVDVQYKSSTGTIIDEIQEFRIPEEIVYPKSFNGYRAETENIKIDSPDKIYEFIYNPLEYTISYETYGGELKDPKTIYTIEDVDYYPPEPILPGREFSKWIPEKISHGEYGNKSFIANYI